MVPSQRFLLVLPVVLLTVMSSVALKPVLPVLIKDFFGDGSNTHNSTVFSDAGVSSGTHLSSCGEDGFSKGARISSTFDSLCAAVALITSPIIGNLSDAFGRKYVLTVTYALQVLPLLMLMLSSNLWYYFIANTIAGLAGCTRLQSSPVLISIIADIDVGGTEGGAQRTANFGWLAAAGGISLLVTPLFASLMDSSSHTILFAVAFGFQLAAALYSLFIIPESLPEHRRRPLSWKQTLNPVGYFSLVRSHEALPWFALICFLSTLPESGVIEIALLYCDDILGLKGHEATKFNASLFTVLGAVFLLSLTLGLQKLLKVVAEHKILLGGLVLNAAHMGGFALTKVFPYKATVYATEIVAGLGFGGTVVLQSMVSKSLAPSVQGVGIGCLLAVQNLNSAIGPALFGWLYASFRCPPFDFPELPFIFGVVMASLACAVVCAKLPLLIKAAAIDHGDDESLGDVEGSDSFSSESDSPDAALAIKNVHNRTSNTDLFAPLINREIRGETSCKTNQRLLSLDLMRGLIMVIMSWDHAHDIIADGKLPRNEGRETFSGQFATYDNDEGLFLSRWMAHFCAPGFFFTMGIGMMMLAMSRRSRGWSWGAIVRHFQLRGLILLVVGRLVDAPFLVPTLVQIAQGETVSHHGHTFGPADKWKVVLAMFIGIFEVMTALGLTMMLAGSLVPALFWITSKRPTLRSTASFSSWWNFSAGSLTAAFLSVAVFAVSNIVIVHAQGEDPNITSPFPRFQSNARNGWELLVRFLVIPGGALPPLGTITYPLIPWIGLTFAGMAAGPEFQTDASRAHRRALWMGALFLVAFVLVRVLGGKVGNYRGWSRGDGRDIGFNIEFFDVCKYPPSPAFALLTLGVDMPLIFLFWRLQRFLCGSGPVSPTTAPSNDTERTQMARTAADEYEESLYNHVAQNNSDTGRVCRLPLRLVDAFRLFCLQVLLEFGR